MRATGTVRLMFVGHWTWAIVASGGQYHRDYDERPTRRAALVSAKRWALAAGVVITEVSDTVLTLDLPAEGVSS